MPAHIIPGLPSCQIMATPLVLTFHSTNAHRARGGNRSQFSPFLAKQRSFMTTMQCCQMYDNYRICTIITPSVRCTINNSQNAQMYDHFGTLQR